MVDKNAILYAGIGIGLYLMVKGGFDTLASKVTMSIPRLRVNDFDIVRGLRADLMLPVNNATSVPVPIQGFTGQLLYGDHVLANIYTNDPITIAANGQTIMSTRVNVNFVSLGENITALIKSGSFLQSLRVKGIIRSLNVNFPVDQTISIL